MIRCKKWIKIKSCTYLGNLLYRRSNGLGAFDNDHFWWKSCGTFALGIWIKHCGLSLPWSLAINLRKEEKIILGCFRLIGEHKVFQAMTCINTFQALFIFFKKSIDLGYDCRSKYDFTLNPIIGDIIRLQTKLVTMLVLHVKVSSPPPTHQPLTCFKQLLWKLEIQGVVSSLFFFN